MKLENRDIDTLHQLALYEFRDRPDMLRRINRRYRAHIRYLVGVIRRASKRKGAR